VHNGPKSQPLQPLQTLATIDLASAIAKKRGSLEARETVWTGGFEVHIPPLATENQFTDTRQNKRPLAKEGGFQVLTQYHLAINSNIY
jgi:hypothetical protein